MKAQYQSLLVKSTAMAASQPPRTGAEEVMRAAIQAGAALLCDHGMLVPPWVPLDIITLRSHRNGAAAIPADRLREEFRPYDDWLRTFLALQSARFGKSESQRSAPRLDGLAALAVSWPTFGNRNSHPYWTVYEGRTFAWIAAYRSLESRLSEMLVYWRGPRILYRSGWETMAESLNKRHRLGRPDGAMVDAFLQGKTAWPVHELFDANAAHLYLSASDCDVETKRATRHAPHQQVTRTQDRPELDSFDEPHHAIGSWTVSTLAQLKYGEFKLANQSFPRVAGRPRSQPPRQVRVHLDWAMSFEALERPTRLPANVRLPGTKPNDKAAAVSISQASVLQALVALLVDDWREALMGISAELHLHPFTALLEDYRHDAPADVSTDLRLDGHGWEQDVWQVPTGGRRWKSDFLKGGLAPPTRFVQRLFRRTTTVELLTQPRELGSDSKGNRSVHDWHCGCLLKDDADAFSGIGEDSGWTWSAGRSGSNWDHVIVLDPEHCTGWITKAEPRMHHVYLRKLSSSGGWDDLSFLNLRKLAARTMLDAVARHAIQASL